eukprot:COSAG02_NODE_1375_length_13001_cov_3.495272_4_plen_151_part_00
MCRNRVKSISHWTLEVTPGLYGTFDEMQASIADAASAARVNKTGSDVDGVHHGFRSTTATLCATGWGGRMTHSAQQENLLRCSRVRGLNATNRVHTTTHNHATGLPKATTILTAPKARCIRPSPWSDRRQLCWYMTGWKWLVGPTWTFWN